MATSTGRIAAIAVLSRLCVVALAAITVNSVATYDVSASIDPSATEGITTQGDKLVSRLFGHLGNWDGVFFIDVATTGGYRHENFNAFFPLLPILMRGLSDSLLYPLSGVLSLRSRVVLSGVLISNVAFVGAAVCLYVLSRVILKSEVAAYRAAVFFCITPAGIFMSAVYTESLFTFLSFLGLLALALERWRYTTTRNARPGHWVASSVATLCFALATATRSNGLVLAGFLVAYAALDIAHWRGKRGSCGTLREVAIVVLTLTQCVLVALPYVAFQYYGFLNAEVARPGRPWCGGVVPSLYGFVQREYWNQGFLHYWEPKQIPNFLFATPVLLCTALGVARMLPPLWQPSIRVAKTLLCCSRSSTGPAATLMDVSAVAYVVLWGALGTLALFCMHVQVATRFLASCPPLYWYLQHACCSPSAKSSPKQGFRYAPLAFCLGYTAIGTTLFSLFYPWT